MPTQKYEILKGGEKREVVGGTFDVLVHLVQLALQTMF